MKIETFSALLKEKHGNGASAFVPNVTGESRRKVNTVTVTFSEGGRVYEYRGTIESVARGMGLAESFEVRRLLPHLGQGAFETVSKHWTQADAEDAKAIKETNEAKLAAWGNTTYKYIIVRA
jgi:hypothetical protein